MNKNSANKRKKVATAALIRPKKIKEKKKKNDEKNESKIYIFVLIRARKTFIEQMKFIYDYN